MIEFEGTDEILKVLERLGNTDNAKQALGQACAVVEASAKRNAIKGTGELRRSITSTVEETPEGLKGIIYTPLEYAPYVEYGTGLFAEEGGRQDVPWNYKDDEGNWHSTSGRHPQPFMRPALHENREQILRILKEALSND